MNRGNGEIVKRGLDGEFKYAVKNTPDIKHGYKDGLQAIEPADKAAILAKKNEMICGSVNIDKEVKRLYPDEPRWDYAIGYNKKVYFVEVHPAHTASISEMEKKLEWLIKWLRTKAPLLDQFPADSPKYYWIATKAGVHISKQSSYARKLAQLKLTPRRTLTLG